MRERCGRCIHCVCIEGELFCCGYGPRNVSKVRDNELACCRFKWRYGPLPLSELYRNEEPPQDDGPWYPVVPDSAAQDHIEPSPDDETQTDEDLVYFGQVDQPSTRFETTCEREQAKGRPSEAYKHTEEILARRALEPGADPEEERRERFKELWEDDEPSAVHLFLSRMSSQSS